MNNIYIKKSSAIHFQNLQQNVNNLSNFNFCHYKYNGLSCSTLHMFQEKIEWNPIYMNNTKSMSYF